jgi:hypothetical protein
MRVQQEFTLVTQSFGRVYEYHRAILAILSFYAVADSKINTLLFTDNPDFFKPYLQDFPIQYVLLTPEKIKEMRGNIDFLHRMKIALIEEAFQISGTHILYADSDTFFLKNPKRYFDNLDETKSYMHLQEYSFECLRTIALPAGKTSLDFLRIIEEQEILLANGTPISISATNSSWNAGVILMHSDHYRFLKDVYALTDQFYPESRNHASEQFAFSIILQTGTDLQPCEELVCHYWYNVKKKIIDDYLATNLPTLQNISKEEKLNRVRKWIEQLPAILNTHVYALKDNAVQSFNNKNFGDGMKWAVKAIAKGAYADIAFIKDVVYHTKVKILNR